MGRKLDGDIEETLHLYPLPHPSSAQHPNNRLAWTLCTSPAAAMMPPPAPALRPVSVLLLMIDRPGLALVPPKSSPSPEGLVLPCDGGGTGGGWGACWR